MVKVAVCQMLGVSTLEDNTKKMVEFIEKAVKERQGLDVIVFPECCYGLNNAPAEGPHIELIRQAARKHRVNILGGSFMKEKLNGKADNTVYFYDREGNIILQYSKTHLMGGMGYDESKYADPGNELGIVDTDFGRIGIILCYELRFPELARTLVLDGAQILFCPAYWPGGRPLPPRTDHWDILVRSTALTNLTWTVACNTYGTSPEGHIPFGRSMVVDPWSMVVAQCSNREEICYADIDLGYQEEVRDSIGGLRNRRPELYKV